jgi:flagellar hook-associated protein 2
VGLRFDAVGGGQFKQAVQQIIEAESQPIKALEKRKGKEDTRLKLFQDFKTKFQALDKSINEISTFQKLRELKVDLGEGASIMSVTVDKERAEPGQYTLQIDEIAARTSTISNGFESADEPVLGMGFITLNQANGDTLELYVEEKKSSLRGISSIINREPGSPVRASVIKDAADSDEPYKLLITAKKDGAQQQVDFPEFYFMDGSADLYIDDDKEAQNALITIDGFEVELESNDANDFLPGVNFHLKQAKPDQPFTLTISEDFPKISGKVKGLVDQLNQVLQFIYKQNAVDGTSDTSTTFAGDGSLQSLEYGLRNMIHRAFPAESPNTGEISFVNLSQIGVEFEKTGQLTFKEEKFNKAIEKDFDIIAQAITGPVGFASQMRQIFSNYTQTGGGVLNIKEQGIRSRIKQIDDQIDQKTRLLERKKQDVVDKFARLQGSLGQMQRQQQYLASALGSGGGNPVAQLMGG